MKTLQTAGCSNLHPRLLCYRLTVDGSASAPRTANSRATRRVSRRWPQPHAVSEQQQQQPEQPGGGRPPPGWSSSFVALSMLKYDEFLQASQEAETEGKAALQTLDDQINELQQDRNTPKWAYRAMAWSRGMAKDAAEMARKRHAAVASKRHLFMEAVTAMDADISEQPEETAVEWMVMAAWNWAQSEEEGKDESLEGLTQLLREALNQPKSPSIVLYAAVLSSLATAWGVAWAGSWWGVDAYRLLHDSPDWGAMAATWLAWTLPYVGGTAAAYFIAPSIITKSIIRPLVTDQSQFYRSVPFASFVFAAGCVAFSQNLVWQGLWQDVFINWMGGSRDPLLLTDPAQLEDSVRLSMGTLVGSPRLPAFLVAPAAALLTGLLEAGFFWTAIQARSINALIPVVTDDGNEEELRAVIAVNVESSPLSPEELLLVSGRVALASSFLCLEGTLTGSLWLPIATSAAGLITAIQLSKRGSA